MAKSTIIGTFEGKSCDANVMNNNSMHLGRDLFDTLVNSEEYQTAIENGWYIGYLGHPEDPGCMDFRNACIVMRDMQMNDNGEVIGKFDLIDTPVGRVVKAFIDAGVTFGISIRGAGDVDADGTVDPETFVFRGYDLVTFPAYNDAIPTYADVAASSDVEKQHRYKKIKAAIKKNLTAITSSTALSTLQEQLNPISEEYKDVEAREVELTGGIPADTNDCTAGDCSDDIDSALYISVLEEKVKALTKLYLGQFKANHDLVKQINDAQYNINSLQATFASGRLTRDRETKAVRRILAAQLEDVESELAETKKAATVAEGKAALLASTNKKLKNNLHTTVLAKEEIGSKLQSVQAQLSAVRKDKQRIQASLAATEQKLEKTEQSLITANTKIRNQKDAEKNNLIYNRKIESSAQQLKEKDSTIADLRKELRETVEECESLQSDVSNRDAEIEELTQRVEACEHLLGEYQQACVDNYADILGVQVNVPVTSTTSVSELKSLVYGSVGIPSVSTQTISEPVEIVGDTDDLVTL